MSKKGRVLYVPREVLDELETIKNIKKFNGPKWRHSAFKAMTKYSAVGQEAERIRDRMTLSDVFKKYDRKQKVREKRG